MKFEKFTAPPAETYHSALGSVIRHEGVSYAVVQDGEYSVPIPDHVGNFIILALRVQDKIIDNTNSPFAKLVSVLNCRKAALVTAGSLGLQSAVDEDSDDLNGVEPLFIDVERLLENDSSEVLQTNDFSQLYTFLDTYNGTFPCIVHLFEEGISSALPVDFSEKYKRLHRSHSFLVLGEDDGEYVCFQKTGPGIREPFAICKLKEITDSFSISEERIGYGIFGPYR